MSAEKHIVIQRNNSTDNENAVQALFRLLNITGNLDAVTWLVEYFDDKKVMAAAYLLFNTSCGGNREIPDSIKTRLFDDIQAFNTREAISLSESIIKNKLLSCLKNRYVEGIYICEKLLELSSKS